MSDIKPGDIVRLGMGVYKYRVLALSRDGYSAFCTDSTGIMYSQSHKFEFKIADLKMVKKGENK